MVQAAADAAAATAATAAEELTGVTVDGKNAALKICPAGE